MKNTTQITGWPKHLMPYDGKHAARTIQGVTIYPYDTTTTKVKSWVAIRNGVWLGLISKTGKDIQVYYADGRASTFPKEMLYAIADLLAANYLK